jgi:hypothetical protein
MLEERFPRISLLSKAERDMRQLLMDPASKQGKNRCKRWR